MVKALAKAYTRADFRREFNQLKASPMKFTFGKGDLSHLDSKGGKEETLGTTRLEAVKNPQGEIDKSKSQVTITLDLDRATTPTVVAREEVHHGVQADNDPAKFDQGQHAKDSPANQAVHDQMESDAHAFANQYYEQDDPNTRISQDEAEDKIKEMMPEPSKGPAPEKPQ